MMTIVNNCEHLSLASQKSQSQPLRFQIANSKSQLSKQAPQKKTQKNRGMKSRSKLLPAIFCGFLRFSAVFCSSKPITLQIRDQIGKKSAKIFDKLPFLPLSHLALPNVRYRPKGVLPQRCSAHFDAFLTHF